MSTPGPASRTRTKRILAVLTVTGLLAVGVAFLPTPGEPPEGFVAPGGMSLPAEPEEGGVEQQSREVAGSGGAVLKLAPPSREVPAIPQVPVLSPRAAHLARLGVDLWQAAGTRGKGVKVAVLDSGFRGYRDHLGKALPAEVKVKSFRRDGNLEGRDSQHGILCAEVIHAIAPEAEILLANWEPDSPEHFLQAVRWARQQGARVISCSMIMPGWSDGEGGGSLHRTLAGILGRGTKAGDALFVASAGNTAKRHWSGPFRDAGDGSHLWKPGQKENPLSPYGEEPVTVEFYEKSGDKNTYELRVNDRTTRTQVGRVATVDRGQRVCATLKFEPVADHAYTVAVKRLRGKGRPFHLTVLGGGLTYSSAPGSIPFPADGAEVIAVGAVDVAGRLLSYSSWGLKSKITKPDLVAPVPFVSSWRPQPFGGTSAAAPQAAALAALWCSRHPQWTANEVRAALRTSALDLRPREPDPRTGYGLVRLPGELGAASNR